MKALLKTFTWTHQLLMMLCCVLSLYASDLNAQPVQKPDNTITENERKWVGVGACGTLINESQYNVLIDDADLFLTENPAQIYPGFTKRLVTCMRSIMYDVVTNSLDVVYDALSNVTVSAITLYLIFFGIRIVTGYVRNLRGDLIVVALTSAAVIYLVQERGVKDYLFDFLDAQSALVGTVTKAIVSTHIVYADGASAGNGLLCSIYVDTWQRIDCTIAYFMGADEATFASQPGGMAIAPYESYDKQDKNLESKNTLAPFAMMIGLLFSDIGPYLIMLGLFIPLLMLAAIAQAIFIYMSSMVIVVFLGLIAPLVIPTLLFRKTQSIFQIWFEALFAYTLQPAIIMSYIAVMIQVLGYTYNPFGQKCDASSNIINGVVVGTKSLQCFFEDWKSDPESKQIKEIVKIQNATEKDGVAKTDVTKNVSTEFAYKGSSTGSMWVPSLKIDAFYGTYLSQFDLNGDGYVTDTNVVIDGKTINELDNSKQEERVGQGMFLQGLITSAVTLLIMFAFMKNVMEFGGQIAGVSTRALGGGLNLYSKAASRLSTAAFGKSL